MKLSDTFKVKSYTPLAIALFATLLLSYFATSYALSRFNTSQAPVATITYPEPSASVVEAMKPPTVEELLRLTNEERAKVGVKPLTIDVRLNQSAQRKADEIERTGVFEHVGFSGKRGITYAEDLGVECKLYNELLSEGLDEARGVAGLLTSSRHKEAMLNAKYDTVGLGVSTGVNYYTFVHHLCDLP